MPKDGAIRKVSAAADHLRSEVAALRVQSAALAAAANAVVITDRDGTIEWVNPAFTTLTGYTLAEAVGKNTRDLVKSGKVERAVYQNLWKTILAGHVWHGELVNRRKDGSLYSEEQTITPVCDAAGGITHFIAIKQDLTERKRAEMALQESEERFRVIFNKSPLGIALVDLEGRPFLTNAACQTMMGRTAEALNKMVFTEFTHPEDRDKDLGLYRQLIAGERDSYQIDKRFTRKDGQLVWTSLSVTLIRDPAGQPKFALSLVKDITERQRAEEMLRQAEAKFHSIFDHAIEGIYQTTPEGKFLAANPAMARILGYASAAELITQMTWTGIARQGYADPARREEFKRVMGRDSVVEGFVSEILCKDGSRKWVSENARAVRDAHGRVLYYEGSFEDISERKRAETALRESEERYRLLFEHAPDAIFTLAPTGAISSLNQAFETITGWPPAEWLGRPWQELIHPADQSSAAELLQVVLRDRRATTFDLRVRTAAGGFRHVEFTGFFSQLSGGHIEVQGIGRDSTERKQAEEALRGSELRYRRLFESAKDGILILDARTGMVVDVNPFLIALLGFSREAFLGKHVWELGFFRDIIANQDHFAELQRQEYIRYEDRPLETADGRRIDVEFVSNVYRVNHHKVIQCNIRDITARKSAERLLREQNDILANSHEGVMVVNLANQVTLWNRGAEEIFGWNAAEALGHPPEKVLGIEDPGVVATLRAAIERDGHWNGELRARSRDGRNLMVEARVTLVRDEAGQPRARLSFLADVTEKKLLEEKFLHAQRLESIGMLAAGIAHDLNNVLAPIMFAAPALRESLSAPRDLRVLSILEESVERGVGLVKQILGFVHSTTDEFRPTQVKHLARDIIIVIEETFPKSIQLEQQFSSDLWQVQGNPTQIHQVLMNLCVNARDAMPQGGTLRITAANRWLEEVECGAIPGARPGAWLLLEVADTGTGIPPEVLERIWTPFFTTKGTGKGTGLGLSTVRSIVAGHHGFVELLTEVGHGSTFRVYLPAVGRAPAPPSSASSLAIPDGHGERILVVDDNAAIRAMVTEILGRHGYHVISCVDGVEAITLFNANPDDFSLVLTDVDMPRLGGAALARALLQLRPDIRILAMSGLSRNETGDSDVPEIRKLAHAFLHKPFKPEDLLGAVHQLLYPIPKA